MSGEKALKVLIPPLPLPLPGPSGKMACPLVQWILRRDLPFRTKDQRIAPLLSLLLLCPSKKGRHAKRHTATGQWPHHDAGN